MCLKPPLPHRPIVSSPFRCFAGCPLLSSLVLFVLVPALPPPPWFTFLPTLTLCCHLNSPVFAEKMSEEEALRCAIASGPGPAFAQAEGCTADAQKPQHCTT